MVVQELINDCAFHFLVRGQLQDVSSGGYSLVIIDPNLAGHVIQAFGAVIFVDGKIQKMLRDQAFEEHLYLVVC